MIVESGYESWRGALGQLQADDLLAGVVDATGSKRGWWSAGRRWVREYGRFHLGAAPFVTAVYETAPDGDEPQELCSVDVWLEQPAAHGDLTRLDGVGWVSLRRFPLDDALATLPAVLAEPGAVRVLRYRPGKRCTLRIDQVDGTSLFVKVLSDGGRGPDMHADTVAIWEASNAGQVAFAAAPPMRWDDRTNAHWQGTVPGAPATGVLFSRDGASLARAMGSAAGSITTASIVPTQRAGRDRQTRRSTKYAGKIGSLFPDLRPQLDELLARLATMHARDTDDRLRPIHGAPHPHQWLLDGDRLGLVDFDGLALGPPELDVATFIAEMEYEDAAVMPVAEIVAGFREGYESVAGQLDDELLAAYVAHKRLAKALRNAQAVRPDNDRRAASALAAALAATTP